MFETDIVDFCSDDAATVTNVECCSLKVDCERLSNAIERGDDTRPDTSLGIGMLEVDSFKEEITGDDE